MNHGTESFITIVAAACLLVAAAIAIVLGAALYRAKSRGQSAKSVKTALFHKALAQFIAYEGGMLIAAGIDLLIRYSHIKLILHLTPLVNVPIITCVVGVFLLIATILGLHEYSDKDADKEVNRLTDMAIRLLSDDKLADKFREILTLTKDKDLNTADDEKTDI